MDHYKVLGLSSNATKKEIKEAFRKLALDLHPDKHSLSSKQVKERATLRFKQVTDAYVVLIDDRKRADYNRSSGSFRGGSGFSGGYGSSTNSRNSYKPKSGGASGNGFNFDIAFRFLTRRGVLLNVAFASILLGGAVAVERSGEAIWTLRNSGKSFEEAIESIQKNKSQRD